LLQRVFRPMKSGLEIPQNLLKPIPDIYLKNMKLWILQFAHKYNRKFNPHPY